MYCKHRRFQTGMKSSSQMTLVFTATSSTNKNKCAATITTSFRLRDLAVSRATVEGLRLLWQLWKGEALCKASSQSSSQKKTKWLARTGEPSSQPIQSRLSRSSLLAVIWSGVHMLMRCNRLIEQIQVIWKPFWGEIEKQIVFNEREGGREGTKQ